MEKTRVAAERSAKYQSVSPEILEGRAAGAKGNGRMSLPMIATLRRRACVNDGQFWAVFLRWSLARLFLCFLSAGRIGSGSDDRSWINLERRYTFTTTCATLRLNTAREIFGSDFEAMKNSLELEAAQVLVEIASDGVADQASARPKYHCTESRPMKVLNRGCGPTLLILAMRLWPTRER